MSKPSVILYVRRDNIIIAGKHITPARLNFPSTVIRNMELINRSKCVAGCEQFFAEHGLKGKRVLIVLDQSIVFHKSVELSKDDKPAAISSAFIQVMPFEAGKRACLQRRQGTKFDLYATNADLYRVLVDALKACKAGKVLAITPSSAYDTPPSGQLSAAMETFASATAVHGTYDFMNSQIE